MASVASQLIQEVTAHAQSDSLQNEREICANGIYYPNNLRTKAWIVVGTQNICVLGLKINKSEVIYTIENKFTPRSA